ncbi:MAG: hypothetical protein IPH07_34285 [Deltaproteobacteria bacterium]|nr:hypothetical protein [Deltaproteobacteria bacterium]MBK8716432.1 hypothetical protein [Deltaproteobacteria bacterium]MBP7287848.1 hypothetical protein [Nannocystaceae bacterium]
MDMYGHKHSNLPQKTVIVAIELVLLGIAGLVLFGPLGASIRAAPSDTTAEYQPEAIGILRGFG